MASRDAFSKKLKLLLREVPADTSLEEWQYLYRQTIFSMGMKILEKFPRDAYGPPTQPPPGWADGSGGSVGGHPNVSVPYKPLLDFAAFALAIHAARVKPPLGLVDDAD